MSEHLPPRRHCVSRTGAGIIALLAGMIALSGCSAGAHTGTTTPAPTVMTTITAPPSASTSTTPTSTPTSPAGSGSYRSSRCLASHLAGTEADGEGAAGSVVVQLVLRNTGTISCTLQGWPGVSFIDSNGHQIGAAATLDRSSVHQTLTLTPGRQVQAALKIAQAINFPKTACDPVAIRHLRVYPPGSTQSIQIDISTTMACSKPTASQLTVQAFTARS